MLNVVMIEICLVIINVTLQVVTMTRDYIPVQETSLLQTDTFGTGEQVSRGE